MHKKARRARHVGGTAICKGTDRVRTQSRELADIESTNCEREIELGKEREGKNQKLVWTLFFGATGQS